MTYAEAVREDRRLAVLRTLQEAPAFRRNASVLRDLLAGLAHDVSRDTLRADLAWLAEQGLVGLAEAHDDAVLVAELTERGADVAAGRTLVPGIKRPSPRGGC